MSLFFACAQYQLLAELSNPHVQSELGLLLGEMSWIFAMFSFLLSSSYIIPKWGDVCKVFLVECQFRRNWNISHLWRSIKNFLSEGRYAIFISWVQFRKNKLTYFSVFIIWIWLDIRISKSEQSPTFSYGKLGMPPVYMEEAAHLVRLKGLLVSLESLFCNFYWKMNYSLWKRD